MKLTEKTYTKVFIMIHNMQSLKHHLNFKYVGILPNFMSGNFLNIKLNF